MLKPPVPDVLLRSIYDMDARFVQERGLKLLLLDLDNTISTYESDEPTERLRAWLGEMRLAGAEPFIFSNNRGDRPARFAEKLGIGCIGRAKKPGTYRLKKLLAEKRIAPGETALVGDQIYTDVFCARRSGVLAVAVEPMDASKPHRALRYLAEIPFRLAAKHRRGNS